MLQAKRQISLWEAAWLLPSARAAVNTTFVQSKTRAARHRVQMRDKNNPLGTDTVTCLHFLCHTSDTLYFLLQLQPFHFKVTNHCNTACTRLLPSDWSPGANGNARSIYNLLKQCPFSQQPHLGYLSMPHTIKYKNNCKKLTLFFYYHSFYATYGLLEDQFCFSTRSLYPHLQSHLSCMPLKYACCVYGKASSTWDTYAGASQ